VEYIRSFTRSISAAVARVRLVSESAGISTADRHAERGSHADTAIHRHTNARHTITVRYAERDARHARNGSHASSDADATTTSARYANAPRLGGGFAIEGQASLAQGGPLRRECTFYAVVIW
jgi:hypothetical protein